jgi:hypothetical protein
MLQQPFSIRETQLFTYVVASGDMRYIPISERTIYLRNDPDLGPVVRGEIGDCGPVCYANLSQILLEYTMSCEGCQDPVQAGELVECIGERLGKILAARLFQDMPDLAVQDRVSGAFSFVLRSMAVSYKMEHTPGSLRYALADCPLHTTARPLALTRRVPVARRGFVALCDSMLRTLAPDWVLVQPSQHEAGEPLGEIVLHY